MTTTDVLHKVQLIKGCFTPSQAKDLINGMIDEKINFHKLNRLSLYEDNAVNQCRVEGDRISELNLEKVDLISVIRAAREQGKNVEINGVIEIKIID